MIQVRVTPEQADVVRTYLTGAGREWARLDGDTLSLPEDSRLAEALLVLEEAADRTRGRWGEFGGRAEFLIVADLQARIIDAAREAGWEVIRESQTYYRMERGDAGR